MYIFLLYTPTDDKILSLGSGLKIVKVIRYLDFDTSVFSSNLSQVCPVD